jgi:uncharacterized protein
MDGMSDSIETLQKALSPLFGRHPEIDAVYLFGSHAKGTADTHSDLDLALVGDAETLQAKKLEILTDVTKAGFDRIDLVVLDGSDIVLQFEAVSPNCLLYAAEGFDHGSYFSRTLREYFDFEPYLRIHREALKARLLNGES